MILLDIVTAKPNFYNKWLYIFAFPVLTRYKQLPTIRQKFLALDVGVFLTGRQRW